MCMYAVFQNSDLGCWTTMCHYKPRLVYVLPHFSLRSKVFNFYLFFIFSGLHMKMDSIRESTAAGLSVTVRKTGIILNVP